MASSFAGAPPFELRVEPPFLRLSNAEIGSYGEGGWRMDAGEAAELFATPRPLVHYIKDMAQTHVCSLWARSKW